MRFSDIPACAGVILLRSDISADAEVILYSPINWAKPNNTCEANITGGANRTRHKANITEKIRLQSKRIFSGGGGRIRTIEAKRSRFTVCPLWPLGNSPRYAVVSLRLGYYSMDLGFVKGENK